jgi:bifunctional DNA primase/polymerase-like protein/primase-like protein
VKASEMVTAWMDGAPQTDHLEAALDYARRGWPVFPLRVKGKKPLIAKEHGGHGCHSGTIEETQIREWWRRWPRANIGIATGRSGFFALDIDPKHDGDDTLQHHLEHHGPLPRTVVQHTGGGGLHMLFKHVDGITIDAGSRLGRGLDVRGHGGYIVVPPSVHESGRLYAWDVDHHPDEMPIAEAPEWVVKLAITPAAKDGTAKAELPENWRRLVANGVREGGRNNAIARLAGKMLRHGLDPFMALDLCRCWNAQRCRPPLDDAEVVRTVDSIAGAELRRRGAT